MIPPGLDIVHAERRFVVVNKPPGLLSVPGRAPDLADCVARRVERAFPDASGPLVVHRLDMDTSGLIVLGLDPAAQRQLSIQFERRRVEKRYVALVEGDVPSDAGRIDLPLRVDWPNRPRQIVCPERGKPASTCYRVLAREIDRTRLELEPLTGRTHQLRVHLADARGLGRPIVGDALYHPDPAAAPRLMLHAATLAFRPPGSRRLHEFHAPTPF